jgi:hypothetical protein
MGNLTDNQWVKRVNEIRQMVSNVSVAPDSKEDIAYYISQEFELTDPDEIRVAKQEFERQYSV